MRLTAKDHLAVFPHRVFRNPGASWHLHFPACHMAFYYSALKLLLGTDNGCTNRQGPESQVSHYFVSTVFDPMIPLRYGSSCQARLPAVFGRWHDGRLLESVSQDGVIMIGGEMSTLRWSIWIVGQPLRRSTSFGGCQT